MGLRCAVRFQLSMVQVDGLHYNHAFVKGEKKTQGVGVFQQGLRQRLRIQIP